jgi:hypothetical protein
MRLLLPLLAGVAVSAAAAPVGQYGRWGVFADGGQCRAVATPIGRRTGAYAAFVTAGRGLPTLVVATAHPGAIVRVRIGDRAAALTKVGDLWRTTLSPGLLAAVRRAERLRIEGRGYRADYPLAGAPSALDAAIVACLQRHAASLEKMPPIA